MTDLTVFQPSASQALSTSMMGLYDALGATASRIVLELTDGGAGYTAIELRAMTQLQKLRLINGVDLAAMRMRYLVIKEVMEESLNTYYPGGEYPTIKSMAAAAGISSTEFDNIIDLFEVIFPYIEGTLGRSVAEVWEEVGKSNLKEMIPSLKALITGQDSSSPAVQTLVSQILDGIEASAILEGTELTDEQARALGVEELLNRGAQMPNRELRRSLRPDPTAPIATSVIQSGPTRMVLMSVDEDQWNMLVRLMRDHLDTPTVVNLPIDPAARQAEALRVPELRALIDLINP